MRAERGAGRGLAGMAPATLFARRTWIVRPLLGVAPRGAARAAGRRGGDGWIEDPEQRDPRFERARLRASAASRPDGIAGYADDRQRARADLRPSGGGLVAGHAASVCRRGRVGSMPALLDARRRRASVLALRALLAVAGGGGAAARARRPVAHGARAHSRRQRARATLSRCLIAHRGRRARDRRAKGRARAPTRRLARLAQRALVELFLPSFDLALARAVAELAGQSAPPASPFGSHNRG